ncbi:MAG: Ig-like domain-containing protein, partial [Gemmatimonadaceae bacterium]
MRPALRRLPLVALLVALLPAVALGQAGALRVIRAAPNGTANPLSKITVTFDRPVAGSLDRTIDPATILRITPAVAGTLEWRDPVTIRLTPATALPSGRQYTVTIDNAFRAMDGSALAEPYRFSFRVQGPVLLAGNPVGPSGNSDYDHLVPAQKFSVVYSSPVDVDRMSADAFIELNAGCGGAQKMVRMTAASQRRIRDDDDGSFHEAGGWQRDRALDSLRRVLLLVPQRPLPLDCAGELVVPSEIGGEMARYSFRTYGEFRMIAARCGEPAQPYCAAGPVNITFSNPVRGAEVQRRITLIPAAKFVVRDTSAESVTWTLDAKVALHTGYAVVADTAMRDVYGQSLHGNPALGFSTTGYEPTITYAYGRQLVERVGYRTLAVLHVNVDTLVATVAPIPPALEAKALGLGYRGVDSLWAKLMPTATVQRIPVRANADHSMITGVRLPTINAMTPGAPTLFAVRVGGRTGKVVKADGPTAILQVSDVGVHAKIGTREGVVWITGVSDGQAKAGALVTVHDAIGHALASGRTDAQGLVRFTSLRAPTAAPDENNGDEEYGGSNFEGYVSATLGTDRGVAAINEWDADLSPYHFNVGSAWGDERIPVAGALFTERGIYRPGERVYAKAIVRDGSLGALRAPAAGDSVKWVFRGRENAVLREVTSPLSAFGTSDQSVELSSAAAVGQYGVTIDVRRQGKWRRLSTIYYRVAEYRPPEFLVDLSAPGQNHMPGDKLTATTSARYLFGAPMGRAQVTWLARLTSVYPWELDIPGMDDWSIGESGAWWEDFEESAERSQVFASKADTLDATGTRAWTLTLPATPKGRAARVTVEATVTDVNRQVVGTSTTTLVHPAEFYIAARTAGDSWFWKAGTPQSIALLTVRPDGRKVTGVRVNGVVVLREWHRVRRERDGVSEL